MEINKQVFKELLNKGIDVSQYLLLSYFNLNLDVKDLLNNVRVIGMVSVLEKKGYLIKIGEKLYEITQKGKEIVNLYSDNKEVEVSIQSDWISELYNNIEKVIFKNTGKKQHLNGSGKYLKPANVELLKQRIAIFLKKFGNYESKIISKAILNYTNKVTKGEIKYALTILYFIFKEERMGGFKSELLDWIDVEDEEEEINKPINTKQLF